MSRTTAPTLGRDPFARQTLVKRPAEDHNARMAGSRADRTECHWCGQKVTDGTRLYRFDVEQDWGPTYYGSHVYCSKACHDSFCY